MPNDQDKANAEETSAKEPTPPLPPPTLVTLAQMFYTECMVVTGAMPNPFSESRQADPNVAKFQIEAVEFLVKKTEGNRGEEETHALTNMLDQMRMAFVAMKRGEDA